MARSRTSARRPYGWMALAALAVGTFIALLVAAANRPRLPRVGDHWHARYSVVICGRTLPQFPPTPGGVHTHGDGVIHIHPFDASEAGRRANLGRFFRTAGGSFGPDHITLPDGQTYRNGDRCPDGRRGTVRLRVNGSPEGAFDRYVPRDRDTIVVEFGP